MNLDQLYKDFTEKALPQIQQGLQITKDYFTDLFGRYVKYLIGVDIFYIILGVIFTIAGIIVLKKFIKWGNEDEWDNPGIVMGTLFLGVAPIIIGIAMICVNTLNLVQTIYVPEISIYQAIQQLRNPQ